MRIFIVLAIVLGVGYLTITDYVRQGKLERWLDAHPHPARNAQIEYYWGVTLRRIRHPVSAEARFRRLIKKYPETAAAPNAWVEVIDMLDERGDRQEIFREAALFEKAYPLHPKVAYVKRKIYVLQSGI